MRSAARVSLVLLAALASAPARGDGDERFIPVWCTVEPVVVPEGSTGPVTIAMGFPPEVTGAEIFFPTRTPEWTIRLTRGADGIFRAEADRRVLRSALGYLRVLGGDLTLFSGTVPHCAGVAELPKETPRVKVVAWSDDVQYSPRVFNVRIPDAPRDGFPLGAAMAAFYRVFDDDYDILELFSLLPSRPWPSPGFTIRNEVRGIGLPLMSDTTLFGTFRRLRGFDLELRNDSYQTFDGIFYQRLMAHWGNYLTLPQLGPGPCWPPSPLARGALGACWPPNDYWGTFPFSWTPQADGTVRLAYDAHPDRFHELELYLLGLLPESEVPSIAVPRDRMQALCNGCVLHGPFDEISIRDVIDREGRRDPDAHHSRKTFRLARIVVTRDRLLTLDEMTYIDAMTALGESRVGFKRGERWYQPFFEATGGRGTIDFQLGGSPHLPVNEDVPTVPLRR